MLIGPVKVELLPVTHELIGVDYLLPAITIRIIGGFLKSVCVDELDKAAVCGSVD